MTDEIQICAPADGLSSDTEGGPAAALTRRERRKRRSREYFAQRSKQRRLEREANPEPSAAERAAARLRVFQGIKHFIIKEYSWYGRRGNRFLHREPTVDDMRAAIRKWRQYGAREGVYFMDLQQGLLEGISVGVCHTAPSRMTTELIDMVRDACRLEMLPGPVLAGRTTVPSAHQRLGTRVDAAGTVGQGWRPRPWVPQPASSLFGQGYERQEAADGARRVVSAASFRLDGHSSAPSLRQVYFETPRQ